MMLYQIFKFTFHIILRIFYRYEMQGKANVPDEGGVLLCCNHIHAWDPPLLGAGLKRNVVFMAKAELFKIPVVSFFVKRFGAFPVKRGAQDKQALKNALRTLNEGRVLGIFPEGTRSKDGHLGKGLSGVGLMALKTNAAVIPVAIVGPYRLFSKITICYGESIPFDDLREQKSSSELVRVATERIMSGIQKELDRSA